MPIAFRTPPGDRLDHARDVKRARGTACYGALAAHFGTDSPKELEWRVDGRRPYHGGGGDESISNKYLRWRQGKSLPHDGSLAHVATRSGGSVRLGFWRDLTLWELLAPDPPAMSRLHLILETSPRPVSRILFGTLGANPEGRFHHALPERSQTLAIRNLYSLDALTALLCLARKGEILEDDPQHYLPSACAFDILPRVLYSYPPLRYRWEGLFTCIERLFWNRVYVNGSSFTFPMTTIRSNLEALDADPATSIPRMSGRRNRVLGTDHLGQLQERLDRAVSVS